MYCGFGVLKHHHVSVVHTLIMLRLLMCMQLAICECAVVYMLCTCCRVHVSGCNKALPG